MKISINLPASQIDALDRIRERLPGRPFRSLLIREAIQRMIDDMDRPKRRRPRPDHLRPVS